MKNDVESGKTGYISSYTLDGYLTKGIASQHDDFLVVFGKNEFLKYFLHNQLIYEGIETKEVEHLD